MATAKTRRASGQSRARGWMIVAAGLAISVAIQACDARPLPIGRPDAATNDSGVGGAGVGGSASSAGGSAGAGVGGSAGAGVGGACGAASCVPGTIQEFPLPPRALHAVPSGITSGPDGALWFTELQGGIGRITTSGQITELPCPMCKAQAIVTGPDGHLWFIASGINAVGRLSVDGVLQLFMLPTADSAPFGIAAGPDGNVWITETNTSRIGRFVPNGKLVEFPTPSTGAMPSGIVAGTDGNLWFTEPGVGRFGIIDVMGGTRELPNSPIVAAHGMALGGDGNIWFTVPPTNQVGTIDASGIVTLFPTLTLNAVLPWTIARGPRGELWYTRELARNHFGALARLALDSSQSEFLLPHPSPGVASLIGDMTTGPDGALWFTESSDDIIGRLVAP
jgi:virginiamycin B lyase